jgi:MFS family permease
MQERSAGLVDDALTSHQRRQNLVAVIAAMAVAALIYGLSLPLLSLVMNERGVESTIIGLSTAVQSVGMLMIAPFLPAYMRRSGPAAPMLGAILVTLVAFLLLPVFSSLPAWIALRFIIGCAGSVLWICGEAWINQVATDRIRGRVVALYSMAVAAGFAVGPLLLSLTGSRGATPFLISSAIMLLAALPLLTVMRIAPRLDGERTSALPRYFLLAPLAMSLFAVFAVVEGISLTFLPLYGIELGLTEAQGLYLITLMGVGGIVGQIPIGWLADHVDRMFLAAACILFSGVAGLLMPVVLAIPSWNWVFMLLFGAALSGIYTVAMVIIGDQFRGADLAAASALYGIMWGAGSVLGPPIGGVAMDLFPPHGVPLSIAALFAAFLPFAVISCLRRHRSVAGSASRSGAPL